MKIPSYLHQFLTKIELPAPDSHKGQNGKLLIIGGSQLFHAASKWSLDIASKFVDMVFYSSVPQNNELIKEAKQNFWNGIVVPRKEIENYVTEADCVLIGPGMERDQATAELVKQLLTHFPDQKWVIDAGALQMLQPKLLRPSHILTPHHQELARLMQSEQLQTINIQTWLTEFNQPTLLLKGPTDQVFAAGKIVEIEGGNAGMTKGGTGDVLAGLVAALYCSHEALIAAVVASLVNKKAGEALYRRVGPYYNASDLVTEVPLVMWSLLHKASA